MGTAAAPATRATMVTIDRSKPLYEQILDDLRFALENDRFSLAEPLPTPAGLALELKVSKTIVIRVYQKLAVLGLLRGNGTVGYRLPTPEEKAAKPRPEPVLDEAEAKERELQELVLAELEPKLRPIEKPKARKRNAQGPGPAAKSTEVQEEPAPLTPPTPLTPEAKQKPALKTAARKAKAPAPQPAPKIAEPEVVVAREEIVERKVALCKRLSTLEKIDFSKLRSESGPRPFRPGFPDTQEFPLQIWEGLRARLLKDRAVELLEGWSPLGHPALRKAIASRLRNTRGLRCTPEQVIVCAGGQAALNLVVNTLVSPGDAIGMEEPGLYSVKAAFLQAGAKVFPLLVDEEGLIVPDARRNNPPLLIYTTPPNQFPLGTVLTAQRRQALLEFANQTKTWILEDDSDADFSYAGAPPPSVQGTGDQNRVIYLGTTGKTLFPSLEIGYVVVPTELAASFEKTKEILGSHPCGIDQATLAHFLGEGHFDRHVRRMNFLYFERLQALSESAQSELKGMIDLEPAQGGLHAVGWLARGLDENVVAASAANAGIELPLISSYGSTAMVRPGVVFGFASYTEKKIRQGVHKLGKALRGPQNAGFDNLGPAVKKFLRFKTT